MEGKSDVQERLDDLQFACLIRHVAIKAGHPPPGASVPAAPPLPKPPSPDVIRYVHNHLLPAAQQKHSFPGRLGLFLGVCLPARSRFSLPAAPVA